MTGLTEVKINGQTYGVKFGMLVFGKFSRLNENGEFTIDIDITKIEGMIQLVYFGIENYNFVYPEKAKKISFSEFAEAMDGDDDELFSQLPAIIECFMESKQVSKMIEAGKEAKDDTKKKK